MRGIETVVRLGMAEAEAAVRGALSEEGFGVLSDIDVSATLRAKLGLERPPLKILGACNPNLAARALEIDPSVALLLPCNVVLEEEGPGVTRVQIADPRALMPAETFEELGGQASALLEAVIARLEPLGPEAAG